MHRRKALAGVIVGAASIALVAAAPAGATNNFAAETATTKLTAKLSGANVVPGPGDPDGSGKAKLTLTRKEGKNAARICSKITFQGIEPPDEGLVGFADPNASPPFIYRLFESFPAGASSPVSECERVSQSLVRILAKRPRHFDVVLNNSIFPTGAIRGQLRPREP